MPAEVTRPKPFAFVLMPFADEFNDVYKLAITTACERAGVYAERVDEQIFEGSILQRIYNQIAKADFIVADLSGRNANVFYEVGYAHALGKRTILLTRDVNDIPFDLKHHAHIIYGGKLTALEADLERRLKYLVAHPESRSENPGYGIDVQVNDSPIEEGVVVKASVPASRRDLALLLALHNSAESEITTRQFELAVIAPPQFTHAKSPTTNPVPTVRLPDGRNMHILITKRMEMMPDTWKRLDITVQAASAYLGAGMEFDFAVRLFTPAGAVDKPFRVRLG